jgi:hypothetical protein
LTKLKITYAEGCFDDISEEMTQDEIDVLIGEIEKLVESGEIFENGVPLTDEEVDDFLDELEDPNNRYPRQ